MIIFFDINSYLQLDFIRLHYRQKGYRYKKTADTTCLDLLAEISSNDMFYPVNDYLVYLDKSNAKDYESLVDVSGAVKNLVVAGLNLDKRSSVYNVFKNYSNKNSELEKLLKNSNNLIKEYLKAKHNLVLTIDDARINITGQEDSIIQEITKRLPELKGTEVKISEIVEYLSSKVDSNRIFDRVLKSLNSDKLSSRIIDIIKKMIEDFGPESIWNAIVWYGDMGSRLVGTGAGDSLIGVSAYTEASLNRLGIAKLKKLSKLTIKAEIDLKVGNLDQKQAIYFVINNI